MTVNYKKKKKKRNALRSVYAHSVIGIDFSENIIKTRLKRKMY